MLGRLRQLAGLELIIHFNSFIYMVHIVQAAVMFDLHAVTMGLLASVGTDFIEAVCISHRLATDVLTRATLSDLAREALSTSIRGTGRPPAAKVIKVQRVKTTPFYVAKRDPLRANDSDFKW